MQRNIEARGTVAAECRTGAGSAVQVQLDNGHRVVAERPRTTTPRLVPGDRVTVELSPSDLARGHITMWTK